MILNGDFDFGLNAPDIADALPTCNNGKIFIYLEMISWNEQN